MWTGQESVRNAALKTQGPCVDGSGCPTPVNHYEESLTIRGTGSTGCIP